MKSIMVISNQSLVDIAIEQYGSIDAVFDISITNGMSITSDLIPGTTVLLPEITYENEIAQYFAGINKKIATNINYINKSTYTFPQGEFPITL